MAQAKMVWALAVLAGTAAQAAAPVTSLRPVPRPIIILLSPSATLAPLSSLRPKARPTVLRSGGNPVDKAVQMAVVEKAIQDDLGSAQPRLPTKHNITVATRSAFISPFAVARSLMPKKRPKKPNRTTQVARVDPKYLKAEKPVRYRLKGSVCGIKGIRGYSVPPVRGKIKGCTIVDPVKITEIDGVVLTREALVGCEAAKSLFSWINKSAKPIIGRQGGGLAKIQMIGGYSCRNRNSAKNGKLSEHAKGKAMDIAGFVLKDGSVLSVKKDWRSRSKGKTLNRLHKAACGTFGTVLGPNVNKYHQNHFHVDVARYRGGTYCR